ncbi:TPA: HDOD domain-containing protein [Pseudomonas aeruginosa]
MKALAKIFKNPAALPTISSVVMELLAMSRDPSVPLSSIVKAVSLDQALAAKVLRTANSAYFGRSGTVSRLEDAISTIGIHNFRTTIITTGLLKALPDAPGIDMPTYWKMGLHTAFMASVLAESIGAERDIAFTTGLMQGIGALLIHLVMPDEACTVVQSVDAFDLVGRRPVEQV